MRVTTQAPLSRSRLNFVGDRPGPRNRVANNFRTFKFIQVEGDIKRFRDGRVVPDTSKRIRYRQDAACLLEDGLSDRATSADGNHFWVHVGRWHDYDAEPPRLEFFDAVK